MVTPISILCVFKKLKTEPWFSVSMLNDTVQSYTVLDMFLHYSPTLKDVVNKGHQVCGRITAHLLEDKGAYVRVMLPDADCTILELPIRVYESYKPCIGHTKAAYKKCGGPKKVRK